MGNLLRDGRSMLHTGRAHRQGRRRARHPAFTSVAAVALLGALIAPTASPGAPAIETTDAAWQRSEAAQATLAAGVIPAPRLTSPCQFSALGGTVRVFWQLPEGYTLAEAQIQFSTSGLGSVLAPLTGFTVQENTVPGNGPRFYVTTVPTNRLGGLLGLGAAVEIAITVTKFEWTSQSASVATNAGIAIGLGGSCWNLT